MSSILKALKKVEKEKGPLKGDGSRIRQEIVDDSSFPEVSLRSRNRLPLIFLVLLAGSILAGVLLMRSEDQPPLLVEQPPAVQTAPVLAPVEPQEALPPAVVDETTTADSIPVEPPASPAPELAVTTEPEPPIVDPAPAVVKKEVPPAPVSKTKPAKLPTPEAAAPVRAKIVPSESTMTPLAVVVRDKTATDRASTVTTAAPAAATTTPVSVASRTPGWHLNQGQDQPPPMLLVSEIHWRPSAKERLAVVNDLPVLEGVDIDGARVDRIFKDRIRFVVNGRYHEVLVSGAGAP